MKKILFVAHSGKISGGANRSLLSLMTRLRDDYGYAPSVLTPQDGDELKHRCAQLGIPAYSANYRSCCTTFRHDAKDVLRLGKILAAPAMQALQARALSRALPQDFDLVYTNDRMVAIGAFLAKAWGKPHIWHVRAFGRENKSIYPFFWYRLMDAFSHRVVLISASLYDCFAQHMPKDKLALVHNGLEVDRLPAPVHLAHKGFHMLLCGRIVQEKGQDEAIDALRLLREQGVDAQLYFAGEIPSYEEGGFYASLQRQIAGSGLQAHVHFLGEVQDMPRLRQQMDAELVCSWNEPFGRVTAEAMCAQLPVVGTRSGGTPDIIAENVTGFLYTPGSAGELAEKLLCLARDPQLAAQMGEAGQQRAKTHFTIERCVRQVHQCICDLT